MRMNKKGWIHHPVMLILIAFLVGLLIMWLICKGYIPTGGVSVCGVCK
jgi:hypothetical protein